MLPPETRRAAARDLVARDAPRQGPRRVGHGRLELAGRGITALFAGESGTGKTMAAEVLAGELGLDLYAIDLATVVDKYVGETEKNLDRIFAEADRRPRRPLLRRGGRAVRQALRGPRRARPLREHRGRLPAAAHGGVRRDRDPRDQPAREHRRRVRAPPRRGRRLPDARRGAPARAVGAVPRPARRRARRTSTSASAPARSSSRAATSATSRSRRRSSPPTASGRSRWPT